MTNKVHAYVDVDVILFKGCKSLMLNPDNFSYINYERLLGSSIVYTLYWDEYIQN